MRKRARRISDSINYYSTAERCARKRHGAAQSADRQTVLAALENVADTRVSLEQDADALAQTRRAADAALQAQADPNRRYRQGATPWSSALSADE